MSQLVKVNNKGELVIPPSVLGNAEPDTPFEVDMDHGKLIARQLSEAEQYWAQTTPEQRAKDFIEWMNEPKPAVPDLPDEAFSRESIYD